MFQKIVNGIRAWRRDERAVSEIIGESLLVGITVAITIALIVSMNFIPTPTDTLHLSIQATINSGPDDTWGTGDEVLIMEHIWGDPVNQGGTTVRITIEGAATSFSGAGLGTGFSDGTFTLSEQWRETVTGDIGDTITLELIATVNSEQQLVASTSVQPAVAIPNPCDSDALPPTVNAWVQGPDDVDVGHSGPVTVQATVVDACAGVDQSSAPRLFWGLGASPPSTYNDAGLMNRDSTSVWSGAIPAQSWSSYVGQTIYYYIEPIRDNNGNSAPSAVQSDLIDAVTSVAYVTTVDDRVGDVLNIDWAKAANDSDASASYREEGTTVSGAPTETKVVARAASTSGGVSNPHRMTYGYEGDEARYNDEGDESTLTNFPISGPIGVVTEVHIGFEAEKRSDGRDASMYFEYQVDGGPSGRQFFKMQDRGFHEYEWNITSALASWREADLENLALSLESDVLDTDMNVNEVYIRFVQAGAAVTTYSMAIANSITPVQAGSSHELQIRYKTPAAEDFEVHVWNYALGTWIEESPTMDATGFTVWRMALDAASQISAGEVQVLFIDDDPGGTSRATLTVDYLRVVTTT